MKRRIANKIVRRYYDCHEHLYMTRKVGTHRLSVAMRRCSARDWRELPTSRDRKREYRSWRRWCAGLHDWAWYTVDVPF